MYEQTHEIPNNSDTDTKVILEPWGSEWIVPPSSILKIIARAQVPGELEIQDDPYGRIVWFWHTAVYKLYLHGVLIDDCDNPVPAMPAGMGTREFLGMILGSATEIDNQKPLEQEGLESLLLEGLESGEPIDISDGYVGRKRAELVSQMEEDGIQE